MSTFPRPAAYRLIATIIPLAALTVGCAGLHVSEATARFPHDRGFVRHQMVLDGHLRDLWMFIPKDYSPSKKWPAIVFLHGLFEAGSDGEAALSAGLGPVIAQSPETWKFIVVFPQSDGTWKGPERERLAIKSLDLAMSRYSIDSERVILAGLSYGGLGAFQIGARHPDRFAAVVSVSGRKDLASAAMLKTVPVWAFHSRGDPFVSYESSEAMCQAVTHNGGNARLTLFPSMDHDCFDRAVGQSDLVNWMLRQRRTSQVAAAAD
jgi:predicted peptidase